MSDSEAKSQTPELAAGSAAGLLTLGGLAAAFGLASCCALPLLLTSLGLGAAWLARIAVFSDRHRGILLTIGALGLIGGAALLWRQQRVAATCGPEGVCTPPAVRMLTLIGLVIGAGLLWAGYTYA
jgi:mercuric ion transport protein